MKKLLALCVCAALCLLCLAGCNTGPAQLPTIELEVTGRTVSGVQFALNINDPDKALTVNSIELQPEEGEPIVLADINAREFTGLQKDTSYKLVVSYSYDLRNDNGPRSSTLQKTVHTMSGETVEEMIDFFVDVQSGRDPIVLQLTDTQIIDAAQARSADRLGDYSKEYWATDQMENRCFRYIRETVTETQPDLILLTGDLVYGEFDDKGTSLQALIAVMESFGIPWAPVFGNHENESTMGVDWQCEQLTQAEHCLFKQRELTGNGNYTVAIRQGDEVKRVFFMLDSNGCGLLSAESRANGHTTTRVGFGNDQIQWYTARAQDIRQVSPNTKLTFAFHIQPAVFAEAYQKYGYVPSLSTASINLSFLCEDGTDFGYLGAGLKSAWDDNKYVYEGIKALGADSILVGHEHANSASAVYEGIRFQYGQKTGTYDRANYQSGTDIVTSYDMAGKPIVGGTVMPLAEEDGSIKDPYIYLCK